MLANLLESFIATGDIEKDVLSFLELHKFPLIIHKKIFITTR